MKMKIQMQMQTKMKYLTHSPWLPSPRKRARCCHSSGSSACIDLMSNKNTQMLRKINFFIHKILSLAMKTNDHFYYHCHNWHWFYLANSRQEVEYMNIGLLWLFFYGYLFLLIIAYVCKLYICCNTKTNTNNNDSIFLNIDKNIWCCEFDLQMLVVYFFHFQIFFVYTVNVHLVLFL